MQKMRNKIFATQDEEKIRRRGAENAKVRKEIDAENAI